MEHLPRGASESKAEAGKERAREDMRRVLAKRADGLIADTGFTTMRHAGEPFALHAAELPRKSTAEGEAPKPVTFDGFDKAGLSVEEARESLGDMINNMADSVRFSFQPAVRVREGKLIVAEYLEHPVGHVRIDILSMDEPELPNKEDIKDLLKRQAARVTHWAREHHLTAEEISLILVSPKRTRREWIEAAAASLAATQEGEEAIRKAAMVIDDVIAMRNRV